MGEAKVDEDADLKTGAEQEQAAQQPPSYREVLGVAARKLAREVDPCEVRVTSVDSYLLIARYNRNKYNALGEERQDEAHAAAEKLFPEHEPVPTLAAKQAEGWLFARSFHTRLHDEVKAAISSRVNQERFADEVVEEVMQGNSRVTLGATMLDGATPDPGIGWILVVKADKYDALKGQFGVTNALWEMYDIEVIPLFADLNTKDIYNLMTPINWSK